MQEVVDDWDDELTSLRNVVNTSASNAQKIKELEGRIARMENAMAKASQ
jgi:hypothetical protein